MAKVEYRNSTASAHYERLAASETPQHLLELSGAFASSNHLREHPPAPQHPRQPYIKKSYKPESNFKNPLTLRAGNRASSAIAQTDIPRRSGKTRLKHRVSGTPSRKPPLLCNLQSPFRGSLQPSPTRAAEPRPRPKSKSHVCA